jgi:hypothetical protein
VLATIHSSLGVPTHLLQRWCEWARGVPRTHHWLWCAPVLSACNMFAPVTMRSVCRVTLLAGQLAVRKLGSAKSKIGAERPDSTQFELQKKRYHNNSFKM